MPSNLDLNDKLIKRGVTVSWHGYRARVLSVRTGRCLCLFAPPGFIAAQFPQMSGTPKWLDCSTVQVVK